MIILKYRILKWKYEDMKHLNAYYNKILYESQKSNTSSSKAIALTKTLYHKSMFSPDFFWSASDLTINILGTTRSVCPRQRFLNTY